MTTNEQPTTGESAARTARRLAADRSPGSPSRSVRPSGASNGPAKSVSRANTPRVPAASSLPTLMRGRCSVA